MENKWLLNIPRFGFGGPGKFMGILNGTPKLCAELITPLGTPTGQYVCQVELEELPGWCWLGHSLFSEPENCNAVLWAGFGGFPNPLYPVITQW